MRRIRQRRSRIGYVTPLLFVGFVASAVRLHADGVHMAFYVNCAQARAAGVTPIREGEPGYQSWLDADGDGIACERWRGN